MVPAHTRDGRSCILELTPTEIMAQELMEATIPRARGSDWERLLFQRRWCDRLEIHFYVEVVR
jgi:hypothetical protein